MTVYTLVSYKEDYHYDRYSDHFRSDWDINVFQTHEDIVAAIFALKVKVKEAIGKGGNDDSWEYVLLIDGRRDCDWTDDQNEEDFRFWAVEGAARDLFNEWMTKEEERKELARIEEEAQKKRSQAAVVAAQTRQEKQLLRTLKEKYPNG